MQNAFAAFLLIFLVAGCDSTVPEKHTGRPERAVGMWEIQDNMRDRTPMRYVRVWPDRIQFYKREHASCMTTWYHKVRNINEEVIVYEDDGDVETVKYRMEDNNSFDILYRRIAAYIPFERSQRSSASITTCN